LKQSVDMERPSDIHGLIYIPFRESLEEVKLQLGQEMNARGLNVNLNKL
jgi:predicted nucleotide-binding protein